jgi:hypothetical protein
MIEPQVMKMVRQAGSDLSYRPIARWHASGCPHDIRNPGIVFPVAPRHPEQPFHQCRPEQFNGNTYDRHTLLTEYRLDCSNGLNRLRRRQMLEDFKTE